MADEELRRLERSAGGDPAAALRAGLIALRAGRIDDAPPLLARAWDGGLTESAEPFVRAVVDAPLAERRRHARTLDHMGRAGVVDAAELWRGWFPPLARLAGPEEVVAPVRDLIHEQASSAAPLRLLGTCIASMELVARAIHALSGRQGFFARSLSVYGIGDVEAIHARRRIGTLALSAPAHFGLGVRDAVSFCDAVGARAIFPVSRELPLAPFPHGPELRVPTLPLPWIPADQVVETLRTLLREAGVVVSEPLGPDLLVEATRGPNQLKRLLDVANRHFWAGAAP